MYGDLTECKHQFGLHDLPEPRFFAYPFSAHETRAPREAAMLSHCRDSLYQAALLDDQADIVAVTSADNVAPEA